jgi:hypothetical protein
VELIGIQPKLVAFGGPVSREISQAVESVYAWLADYEQVGVARASVDMDSGQAGGAYEVDRSA